MSRKSSMPFGGGRGLFVGRYFDIEFFLDYSWFLIAVVLTYTLQSSYFPTLLKFQPGSTYLFMGVAGALLFFLSILLHELGHSLVSQRCGIPVPRITLLFIGGLAEISREPDDAKSELKIAVGGPIVSLGLAAFYFISSWIGDKLELNAAAIVFKWLAVSNLSLVIFNMVPGYPLDGGRILRALLWAKSGKLRRATLITSRIGIGFSWFLVVVGLYLLIVLKMWNGFPFLLIAIFLKSAAETGYAHALQKEVLAGVTVRDVMTATPICIPAEMPLNLAVDEYFLANHHVAFPVVGIEGEYRGMLRLDFLKTAPREKWPYTSAGELAAQRETLAWKLDATTTAARGMRTLMSTDSGKMAVIENGRVIGVITRHDILHFIKIHTELED